MTLLLPQAKGIAVKGWSLICHDLSFTKIGIKLDMLQRCIGKCIGLLMPKRGRSVPIIIANWGPTLERLAWFHPERSGWHRRNFWFGSSKPRQTCNAAVAWSYLKYRDNDRVAPIPTDIHPLATPVICTRYSHYTPDLDSTHVPTTKDPPARWVLYSRRIFSSQRVYFGPGRTLLYSK